ncbi:hypothetical protein CpB0291 [Chlamydia pneumoniae TW-183]|uniref:Uncharacterized protein n=4 Tax=Chlamydia pneumoniae TaxID=83558 RepID=A0A0F7WNI3_CHLPN|nr:hypothetical protein [Chlamydia pneumoniae]AAD18432.1 hypothetical protein CPn_0283 [Chlamydia pneumoniae CWL029]AAP98224.1 hypothetical protein CpB0291 [Chlamydia pneumoniae TW-183]CRI32784.1 Uncharacterized protein BN1224_Wien1_A_02910 [Chlamydia pneumoniae]CRI36774.1 Uncharacterized protein BN1224_CV14_A_02930 [Chlamydia pneumoniae]CRI37897.1 Uncharacterized protein BN1224_CV15_B_02200 [Chlamydia pneumoniae]
MKLLIKFAKKDLKNSSIAPLYEVLLEILEAPGEEILEVLFSLDPMWLKSMLDPKKHSTLGIEISSETAETIESCSLGLISINLLLSGLCLRSSHDRSQAVKIIQQFCPQFSSEEVQNFVEQRNILTPFLHHLFEGDEVALLNQLSLRLDLIVPNALYPEPDPSCWQSINSEDCAKDAEDQQEDFNKTKEACKEGLKKLVLPALSITSIPQLLRARRFKQGAEILMAIDRKKMKQNPFIFLEALLESEEFSISVGKYLKLLMPIHLWDKLLHAIYLGYFQTGLICQGEIETFCRRANLNPEAFQAAIQQGRLLSFLFPKMLLD